MNDDLTLEPMEHDLLLEAASVAAGKIVGALSNITGQKVELNPPTMVLEHMEKIADSMGSSSGYRTVVYIQITGQANGAILLVINPDYIDKLVVNLPRDQRLSAIEEITNIVGGSALGALSKLLNMMFLQSVPHANTGMLRALINEVVSNVGIKDSKIISLNLVLKVGEEPTEVPIYLLFDNPTTTAIIEAGKDLMQRSGSGN
jgi:chemotaxis protein CheY-P-specific phosphatase CheC